MAHSVHMSGDNSPIVASMNRWYDEMEEWIDEVLPAGSSDDVGFFAGHDASAKAPNHLSILFRANIGEIYEWTL